MDTSDSTKSPAIPFQNTFAKLPESFYAEQLPTTVSAPQLIKVNHALAAQLGISAEWLESEQGIAAMAGNYVPVGAEPVAAAYAGHQFGGWNPQLGDGRAILLGEVRGPAEQLYDIQLKGSGRTPWSRGGDGRSPLGPVLREYLVSEAMAALGVPSSRSLAAVTTGESVYREQTLPGAILCRVARSHIRIGSFQYFAARKDNDSLLALANYVIQRHAPEAAEHDQPILALLQFCIEQQAKLVCKWQSFGFIHGVMNTDNMLLSGETIDYGPCAFMDDFKSDKVFSSIDQQGRYAYCNQPSIAHWNLAQLAQCLLPLLVDEQDQAVQLAQEAIDTFPGLYSEQYLLAMRNKLGLETAIEHEQADAQLISDLFTAMQAAELDFTLTFRFLTEHFQQLQDFDNSGSGSSHADFLSNNSDERLGKLHDTIGTGLADWLPAWQQRLATLPAGEIQQRQTLMESSNPAVIARNHLVEQAINEATEQKDFSLFEALNKALSNPFQPNGSPVEFTLPPLPEQVVQRTFCGT